MPRRCNEILSDDDPPKKKNCNGSVTSSFELKQTEYLKDIAGKQWKLGKPVGVGGFGEIYLASDNLAKEVKTDCKFVAKVENHKNGPLFVEMNCYLRMAKREMIEEWKKEKKMSSLGMPHYVASGSHVCNGEKYRFLILPKFEKDLERVFHEKKVFNIKTVLTISMQIIDVLEYIHSKGYIHSDIKASNILLRNQRKEVAKVAEQTPLKQPNILPIRTCRIQQKTPHKNGRNLRIQPHKNYFDDIPDFEKLISVDLGVNVKPDSGKDQVYLLDYGLACKYTTSTGEHKPFCADERKAHAGTILFCSRDAHKGVPSRRSDLESLGYNIIYWLTGNLPWFSDIDDPEIVAKKKQKAMTHIEYFLNCCFTKYPKFLEDYFKYLQKLQFQEKPDYKYCKKLFRETIKASGYKDDSMFDFDNLQTSKLKELKMKKRVSENVKVRKVIHIISRPPLQSNIPVKPLLRKKIKNKKQRCSRSKWFEDLTDPEIILKQAREKKNNENNDSTLIFNVAEMDIQTLNPTYAMIEVYNKCRERIDASPSYKGDSGLENIDGYTPAMMSVLENIRKRKELEIEQLAVSTVNTRKSRVRKRTTIKNKKNESSAKFSPKTRNVKSAIVVKKETLPTRKVKSCVMKRSYSLRG